MSKKTSNIDNEEEICALIEKARTSSDFFRIRCLISNFFSEKTFTETTELINRRTNFYIRAFDSVLRNENFLEALRKITEQFKYFKKNYEGGNNFFEDFEKVEMKNKKLVSEALLVSTSFLSNVFPNLNEESVTYLTNRFQISPYRLGEIFGNRYSHSEIYHALLTSLSVKHTNLSFPVYINNLEHLFRQELISRKLSLLIVSLTFRGTHLNALFQSIDRDKSRGKFSSLSIYRIAEFINRERKSAQSKTEKLNLLYGENTFIQNFTQNYFTNKNEKNAFELIELTVQEFKNKQKAEEDMLRTIDTAEKIKEKIMIYGNSNFKAFSSSVVGRSDIEWSNKIFINCNRLFGGLSGISKAVDKNWKINVLMNGFSDWVDAVHMILNKYDIEDDWMKIAKYLDQETNKVEWKSSFVTPIELSKDDESYNSVSKKVFYSIAKTLLALINTEGGVILIGLVEKPEEIVEEEIKKNLLEKNKKTFFDISFEFSQNRIDVDGIKRKIQDSLKKETLVSIESFNNLWNIQPVTIKDLQGNKTITIYKIEVSKSDKLIFSSKLEKEPEDAPAVLTKSENIWISLLKRADARTIRVDPRRYLTS